MLDALRDAVAAMIRPGEGRLTHAPQSHPPVRAARIGAI